MCVWRYLCTSKYPVRRPNAFSSKINEILMVLHVTLMSRRSKSTVSAYHRAVLYSGEG